MAVTVWGLFAAALLGSSETPALLPPSPHRSHPVKHTAGGGDADEKG